jgi:hypothetical protein
MSNVTLDQILDALDRGHQRATYGAVAALLNQAPRTLMSGRERDQRHSWVVSTRSGQPTGYNPEQIHPDLQEHADVLHTKEDLSRWLDSVLATA